MDENRQWWLTHYLESKWPGLYQAALELAALREVLVRAIDSLNAFVEKKEQIGWKSEIYTLNHPLFKTSLAEMASPSAIRTSIEESVKERPLSTIIAALHSDVLSNRVAAVDEFEKRMGLQVVTVLIEISTTRNPSINKT